MNFIILWEGLETQGHDSRTWLLYVGVNKFNVNYTSS